MRSLLVEPAFRLNCSCGETIDQLIRQNPKHRWMVRVWIFVYAFVGIQMAYVLRPFIGSPSNTISFFREDPFENAYVRSSQADLVGD